MCVKSPRKTASTKEYQFGIKRAGCSNSALLDCSLELKKQSIGNGFYTGYCTNKYFTCLISEMGTIICPYIEGKNPED